MRSSIILCTAILMVLAGEPASATVIDNFEEGED